jgi:hypothetical protein
MLQPINRGSIGRHPKTGTRHVPVAQSRSVFAALDKVTRPLHTKMAQQAI